MTRHKTSKKMNEGKLPGLAYFIAVINQLAVVAEMWHVLKTKEDTPWSVVVLTVTSSILGLWYGYANRLLPLVYMGIIDVVLAVVLTGIKLHYAKIKPTE